MKIGIIVYSDDPETVWNALRYGNYALAVDDKVHLNKDMINRMFGSMAFLKKMVQCL